MYSSGLMDIFLPDAKLETQKATQIFHKNRLTYCPFSLFTIQGSLSLGYLSIQLKSMNYLMSTIAGMVKTERGSTVTSIVNNVSLPPC